MHLPLALAPFLSLLGSLAAGTLHHPHGRDPAYGHVVLSSSSAVTSQASPISEEAVLPSPISSSSSSSSSSISNSSIVSCDLRYCSNGTSYCHYWGGFTSFDLTQNKPVPGETFKILGPCTVTTPHVASVTATTRTGAASETTGTPVRRRHRQGHRTIPETGTSTSTIEALATKGAADLGEGSQSGEK